MFGDTKLLRGWGFSRLEPLEQQFGGKPAHFAAGNGNRRQRGVYDRHGENIVETDQAEILRDPQAHCLRGAHYVEREVMIVSDDRGGSPIHDGGANELTRSMRVKRLIVARKDADIVLRGEFE